MPEGYSWDFRPCELDAARKKSFLLWRSHSLIIINGVLIINTALKHKAKSSLIFKGVFVPLSVDKCLDRIFEALLVLTPVISRLPGPQRRSWGLKKVAVVFINCIECILLTAIYLGPHRFKIKSKLQVVWLQCLALVTTCLSIKHSDIVVSVVTFY